MDAYFQDYKGGGFFLWLQSLLYTLQIENIFKVVLKTATPMFHHWLYSNPSKCFISLIDAHKSQMFFN